jgi:hypothetical protein
MVPSCFFRLGASAIDACSAQIRFDRSTRIALGSPFKGTEEGHTRGPKIQLRRGFMVTYHDGRAKTERQTASDVVRADSFAAFLLRFWIWRYCWGT